MSIEWRGNDCPERGPGLSHVTSPTSGSHCIKCGILVSVTPPQKQEQAPEPAPQMWATVFDHRFSHTITGRCVRCGKFEAEHAKWQKGEPGECAVDHESIQPWHVCPICGVTVEPKLARGAPSGPDHGPGRGDITKRYREKLEAIYGAWLAGYYES